MTLNKLNLDLDSTGYFLLTREESVTSEPMQQTQLRINVAD